MASHRIFDATIIKTCRILVGGDYQGVLRPNIDYIVLCSWQISFAVSIAPAVAAKRNIYLCGWVHRIILSGQSF